MTCQAKWCGRVAAFTVDGPGKAMALCSACAERVTKAAKAAGVPVRVYPRGACA